MLRLAATDLCTKIKITTLSHYKGMNGDEKCKTLGSSGVSTLPRDWNYSTNCVIAATAAAANGPVAYYHIFER